jgi:hypothetical protein
MSDADDFEFELLQERRRAEAPVAPDTKLPLTIAVIVCAVVGLILIPFVAVPALVILALVLAA